MAADTWRVDSASTGEGFATNNPCDAASTSPAACAFREPEVPAASASASAGASSSG
jgi:hypothetical protein